MAASPSTFSESWHRIAGQRIALRPGVKARRQNYRGERWIVLENPFSNQYFRLRPAAYEFVARLRPDRTVEEVWKECLNRFPDEAPGQEAVLRLLSQLYFANLLQYDRAEDSAQLFERFKQRRQRELRMRLMNLMFMRFPLLDPDRFLVKTLPVVGKLISPVGALIWMVVVGWALKLVADNWQALWQGGQGVLAPDNLVLLYSALVIVKTLHEFGHAYFCRKFGGEVHVMGVLLMIFTPVPYMDATSSWGFRSKWKRVLVGFAGMIVELFVAALATFVWAWTAPGSLNSLAYNMMFIASVSTVIFNINPLLRYDGYYILSDLVGIPNLSQRSTRQLRHLCERYLFGVTQSESPTESRREAAGLVAYGLTSGVYRVVVFAGVLLFVADQFLILGLLMAAICAISWVTVPVGKLIHYLASSPRLDRVRPRAIGVTLGLVGVLIVLMGLVPFPYHFRAPGVVQAEERTAVATRVSGQVKAILTPSGAQVAPGQPLVQLVNPEMDMEMADVQARLEETQARIKLALERATADLKPLQSRLVAISNRLDKLNADRADLVVKASHKGVWVAPGMADSMGRRIERGTPLGLLINPAVIEFVATVEQEDADAVFAARQQNAEIRLYGQAGEVVPVEAWRVIPGGKRSLPSPALGWRAGGELAVSAEDPSKTSENFFEVHAAIPERGGPPLLHGRSGKIRFDLEPQPLIPRWWRRLNQLLQKRYQL